MTTEFKEMARKHLPDDALEVTKLAPFVVRYGTPNGHCDGGIYYSTKFLGHELAEAVAKPSETWHADKPENSTCEYGRIAQGNLEVWFKTRGYGVNAHKRIEITSRAKGEMGISKTGPSITVSAQKDAATIAEDIARRVLPGLLEADKELQKQVNEAQRAASVLECKLAELIKKYGSHMRFKLDTGKISASSKFGGNASLSSATIYEVGDGKWKLSSHSLRLEDIDSKSGRALMRALCA